MSSLRSLCLLLAWVPMAASASDAPFVPPDLEPWVDWVLEDAEAFECPFIGDGDPADAGQRICAWPGMLEVTVEGNTAAFRQRWTLYHDDYVQLPGDGASWPQNVRVDGTAVAVIPGERSRARVWLTAGEHEVEGAITWPARPAALSVPATTGLIRLTVDGTVIDHPQRADGSVWLGERPRDEQAPETIGVRVHRLFRDGLPKTLVTRVALEVSGRNREVILGRALPEGFLPMRLRSELPARLDPDGRLRLQVRAGLWGLDLTARDTTLDDQVTIDSGADPWADEEIWSWQPDPSLRVTIPEGDAPVDPVESGVPEEWRRLPAFRLVAGDVLTITERGRGDQTARGNDLRLQRRVWLDFDGDGWTAVDRIEGLMFRDWRLDMAAPWTLHAARTGDGNLLVTRGDDESRTGVELRNPVVDLTTVARLETTPDRLAASGWQADFSSQETLVVLPPGHRLLHARGADQTSGTWLTDWRLMDFFLLLLITVSVARLFGRSWAALTLAMLILTWQETNAPQWAWLVALAATALAQVAPEGRLRAGAQALRNVALAGLVIVFLPWAGNQTRLALHPDLDTGRVTAFDRVVAEVAAPSPAVAVRADGEQVVSKTVDEFVVQDRVAVTGSRTRSADLLSPYAPGTLVQAGPGIPAWQGPTYRLSWEGRVTPEEDLRVVILGASVYRLIRLVGVVLAGLLILRLAAEVFRRLRARMPGVALAPVIGLIAVSVMMPPDVEAADTFPDRGLLQELRERLLQPPPCERDCISAASVDVVLTGNRLRIAMVVHAAEAVAAPLPFAEGWQPGDVSLDGRAFEDVHRSDDGIPRARIPPGIHRLELSGPMPAVNELRIVFPLRPQRADVDAPGWDAGGLAQGRIVGGALQLTRRVVDEQALGPGLDPGQFPAFLEVRRSLVLDVDWRLQTRIRRLAPTEAPFSFSIPLIEGEAPRLGDDDADQRGLSVVDAQVRGTMGVGRDVLFWESDVPSTGTLVIQAPDELSREEIWDVTTGNMWRARFEGTPVLDVPDMAREHGTWVARFRPRPGERLTIHASRVEGVAGDTLAIDSATLNVVPGNRATTSRLSMRYRSTRGGRHTIALPAEARVSEVLADGAELSVRPEDGQLSLPVQPGQHSFSISWEHPTSGALKVTTPVVDLGTMAANVSQQVTQGRGRWVLFAWGPGRGPAILYWSELALFLVIAVLLGRTRIAPANTRQWLLLGLGFSTFAWGVLILTAGWLFATGWRARTVMPERPGYYNLVQAGYALLTVMTVLSLVFSVPMALLGNPRMHIQGVGSSASSLTWFTDRVDGALASASVLSAPLWVYQAAILLWALWLAFAAIGWLRASWTAWSTGGLWRGRMFRRGREKTAGGSAHAGPDLKGD